MDSTTSAGILPASALAWQAAISTSSHLRNLFSSVQIAPISGNVYRLIITDISRSRLFRLSIERETEHAQRSRADRHEPVPQSVFRTPGEQKSRCPYQRAKGQPQAGAFIRLHYSFSIFSHENYFFKSSST